MKQFLLLFSFVFVTLVGSQPDQNQDQNYVASDFKKGFFGTNGFFALKKINNNNRSKDRNFAIKKAKDVTPINVECFTVPQPQIIRPVYNDPFIMNEALVVLNPVIMNKALVVLDPEDTNMSGTFSWGFQPKVQTSRKQFLEERLQHLGINKGNECFYPIKEDENHVSWHIKGIDSGSIPVMIEYRHDGCFI